MALLLALFASIHIVIEIGGDSLITLPMQMPSKLNWLFVDTRDTNDLASDDEIPTKRSLRSAPGAAMRSVLHQQHFRTSHSSSSSNHNPSARRYYPKFSPVSADHAQQLHNSHSYTGLPHSSANTFRHHHLDHTLPHSSLHPSHSAQQVQSHSRTSQPPQLQQGQHRSPQHHHGEPAPSSHHHLQQHPHISPLRQQLARHERGRSNSKSSNHVSQVDLLAAMTAAKHRSRKAPLSTAAVGSSARIQFNLAAKKAEYERVKQMKLEHKQQRRRKKRFQMGLLNETDLARGEKHIASGISNQSGNRGNAVNVLSLQGGSGDDSPPVRRREGGDDDGGGGDDDTANDNDASDDDKARARRSRSNNQVRGKRVFTPVSQNPTTTGPSVTSSFQRAMNLNRGKNKTDKLKGQRKGKKQRQEAREVKSKNNGENVDGQIRSSSPSSASSSSHKKKNDEQRAFNRKISINRLRKQLFTSSDINTALKRDPHMTSNATELARWGRTLIHDMAELMKDTPMLQKHAISDTTRLLFLAGLEGTGHHAWQAMMQPCLDSARCVTDHELNLVFMDEELKYVRGMFAANDYHLMIRDCQYALARMAEVAASDNSSLHLLGMDQTPHTGQLSYPSFSGEFKALDRPDVFLLASLAEIAGLDLRVLVLQRSANEVLASTLRRGFSPPKMLLDNAAALYQQLSMLHPSFFYCVDYNSMHSMNITEKQSLLQFMHPVQLEGMEEVIFAQVDKPHRSKSSTQSYIADVTLQYYARQLAAVIARIDRLCESGRQYHIVSRATASAGSFDTSKEKTHLSGIMDFAISSSITDEKEREGAAVAAAVPGEVSFSGNNITSNPARATTLWSWLGLA